MKKILLLMTLFLALGFSAKAAENTFNMKTIYGSTTISGITTKDWGDFKVTADKATGQTAPAYNKAGDVRLYANNTFTITSPNANITKIAFTISTQGKKQYSEITVAPGAITEQGAAILEWTGDANEIKFTVGSANKYGTATDKNSGQLCFDQVVITTSDAGVAVLAPIFTPGSSNVMPGTEVEITCGTEGATIYYTTNGDVPTDASTKYEQAISIDENMTIKAIAYKGADKSSVSTATYTLIETANTLAKAKTYAKGATMVYTGDLTLVYKSGANAYVYDGVEYALIYGTVNGDAGQVIKGGWEATVDIYSGLFELKPTSKLTAEGTAEIPAPTEITAENIATVYTAENASMYCLMKDVTFAAATPATRTNINGTVGETTVAFRNNFNIASVEAGKYDVLGFIAVYNGNMQFYPIEYKTPGTSGIDAIEAGNEAPAVYYNLNGMRIDNPAAGQTVIRVQAGKAAKVRF